MPELPLLIAVLPIIRCPLAVFNPFWTKIPMFAFPTARMCSTVSPLPERTTPLPGKFATVPEVTTMPKRLPVAGKSELMPMVFKPGLGVPVVTRNPAKSRVTKSAAMIMQALIK